ncbi:hypothetical protein OIU85_026685 [Salix viminalis]|uniref:Uncharacterized protein n=1 Tax=Salix viminalis TaxID=40686 RepID=A0A9Q0TP67_SALVM|nr:hypothetical protein OIU85_026685 [Salix viminalis]
MSSPAPGVSPVPFNSTPPPPISNLTSPPPPYTTNKTASQAPPLLASSPRGPRGPGGPSPPVLSALIVGVVLGVLAGVGISVCVYRRKKRKEALRLLLAGQPSQEATKDDGWQHNTAPPPKFTPPNNQLPPMPGIFAEYPSTSSSMGSDKQHPPPTPGIALGYSQNRGSVNFRLRLRLLAVSIIDILFRYLGTALLEPKECLFMNLYPTTPWNFIYMRMGDRP